MTVRNGRSPALAELTAFLTGNGVATPKLPEFLLVLAELPLGRTGEICHRTLTRLAAACLGR
ncbi:hypothetical protein [Amycolatopsis regifaucium]|uniref:AMP-binding enzyme C-terminal domain-containing protein n=1 Tax=Amycolatopsis regifaucium TaxID=546365 RepID=A0A154M3Z1_9PSEU|nr:hypothetical protein [Amycolatopsis regifaucium]KZB79223.1 hypothetical protein AVL48_16620 [Amycolatopsis regifaucium]